MNSEILEEVLNHPIFDQYNEELNATQINMAYYDAMRRNARSVQTAAYAQARINECKEKLAAIDAQIEEAVYTLAEQYQLNEALPGGGKLLGAIGGKLIGAGTKMVERGAVKAAAKAAKAEGAAAKPSMLNRAKKAWDNYTHAGTTPQRGEGGRITEFTSNSIKPRLAATFGVGAAAGAAGMRAIGGSRGGGTTPPAGGPPAGGPPAGGPPAPAGPKPGTPVTTDPTEGPSGYRYPSSNKKFSDEVTDAAYSNKLVGSGKSPDKIYPGQKLKIGGADVTVQKGDTLSGLVQKSRIAKKAGQAGRTGTTADGSAGMSQLADF